MGPVTTKQLLFFSQKTETRRWICLLRTLHRTFVPNGFPKIRGCNHGFFRKPPSDHPPIRRGLRAPSSSICEEAKSDWYEWQLRDLVPKSYNWLINPIKYISIYVCDLSCRSTVPSNLELHSAITAWMAETRRIIPAALRQWSGACPLQCRWSLSFAPWAACIHSYTFWTTGPLVIKGGNGKPPINEGFNGIHNLYMVDFSWPCWTTSG